MTNSFGAFGLERISELIKSNYIGEDALGRLYIIGFEMSDEPEIILKKFGQNFTEVKQASVFYRAEEYHQNYYKKNPLRYKYYKYSCRRTQTLRKLWGAKPVFAWE